MGMSQYMKVSSLSNISTLSCKKDSICKLVESRYTFKLMFRAKSGHGLCCLLILQPLTCTLFASSCLSGCEGRKWAKVKMLRVEDMSASRHSPPFVTLDSQERGFFSGSEFAWRPEDVAEILQLWSQTGCQPQLGTFYEFPNVLRKCDQP